MAEAHAMKYSGAVLLLDRLGTKGIWKGNPEDVLASWDNFTEQVAAIHQGLMKNKDSVTKEYGFVIDQDVFSDTFILTFTSTNNARNITLVKFFTVLANLVFIDAFEQDIFFRGCISAGDFYRSSKRRAIIGPAIDEASQYYTTAEWLGISLAPSANLVLYGDNTIQNFGYVRYNLPMKTGIESNAIVLNWVQRIMEKGALANVRQKLLDHIKTATDVSIAFKYRNTLDFVDSIERISKSG